MEADLELRTLAAEDGHWWYRGRLRMVMDAVCRAASPTGALSILDVGCGGGATMVELSKLGDVTGIEPSAPSREKAESRGLGPVLSAAAEALPFDDGTFDMALILDVLEHLDDDTLALREIRRVVAPGGSLIVTVPAHPRLWSRHDELNHHRRRYTRGSLVHAARGGGWEPIRVTHFMLVLLPAAVAARRIAGSDGLEIPPAPVNRTLRATIDAEAALIRRGVALPAGLSILAELRRA